jgi:hypothetical protein
VDDIACPKCGRRVVRRSHRTGLVERVLSAAYIYPFRCQLCQHRFRRFEWGVRYIPTVETERRRYERMPARVMIGLQWEREQHAATLSDVSIAGATVETDVAVPEGVLLQLTLQPTAAGPVIDVSKALVRSVRGGRLGVEFVEVGDEERERLREFVEGLVRARQA